MGLSASKRTHAGAPSTPPDRPRRTSPPSSSARSSEITDVDDITEREPADLTERTDADRDDTQACPPLVGRRLARGAGPLDLSAQAPDRRCAARPTQPGLTPAGTRARSGLFAPSPGAGGLRWS